MKIIREILLEHYKDTSIFFTEQESTPTLSDKKHSKCHTLILRNIVRLIIFSIVVIYCLPVQITDWHKVKKIKKVKEFCNLLDPLSECTNKKYKNVVIQHGREFKSTNISLSTPSLTPPRRPQPHRPRERKQKNWREMQFNYNKMTNP